MAWAKLFAVKDNAIGEVARVDADRIYILVYPEHFHKVRVGSIIAIDSEGIKPVGVVIRTAQESRRGQIQPLRKPREDLLKLYPDIENYYRLVSTVAYTSHVNEDILYHVRASMPRLHDLAFLVDSNELLDAFFRAGEKWDFSFLSYIIREGAEPTSIKELFFTHRKYFLERAPDIKNLIYEVARSLYRAGIRDTMSQYLECIIEVLR